MNLDPQQDVVIVEMDPLTDQNRNGVIVLRDTSAQKIRTATIKKVGPGRRNPKTGERIPLDVKEGDRVAFFRWHQEHKQGQALSKFFGELGDNMAMIRQADILFTFTGELRIE